MRAIYFVAAVLSSTCLSSCGGAGPAAEQRQDQANETAGDEASVENADEANDTATPTGGDNVSDGQSITPEQLKVRRMGYSAISKDSADPKQTGKIEPGAIEHYTRSDYPDVVRRWGKQIKQIDRERTRSARIAVADPRCDGVINAQVSDKSTDDDHRYWVECNNITRYYFDSASLAAGKPAHIQTQADMGNNGLISW